MIFMESKMENIDGKWKHVITTLPYERNLFSTLYKPLEKSESLRTSAFSIIEGLPRIKKKEGV
jgi:hypothetical protein